jgi:serine/threonine protein kinase
MGLKSSKPKKLFEMGKKQPKSSPQKPQKIPEEIITKSSFEFIGIIGRGGFGKVWKVLYKKTKAIYAMKKMSKCKIIDKRSERSIKAERDLLSIMNHPFIINMHFSFQDADYLYIAMDLLTGGDLRYQIFKQKIFFEEQTKFIISCIILSLEYIHTNNILHRDLKPENLVFDHKGYLKLTDFGIAKIYRKENNKDTSGTPGYMAPEVMNAQNHTIAVDYFALGVIGYELMMRKRPYLGKSRKEIKEKIMSHQVQVKKNMVPQGWSFESADFINRLLQRKPANRLGLRGPTEVKEHPWFKGYDWKNLYLGNLKAPFMPKKGDNFDFHYCNAPEKMGLETEERYRLIKGSQKCKDNFIGFYYFNRYANNNNVIENNNNENSKANKEGRDVLKLVMKNPHDKYLKEEEMEIEKSETKKRIERITNYNFFKETSGMSHKNIFFGIGDEQYSSMKKLPSSRSTATLLKGYNKKPLGIILQGNNNIV